MLADTTALPARISPPSNREAPGIGAWKLHQGVPAPAPVPRCAVPADTTVPPVHTGHGNRGNLPLFAAPQPVPGLLRNPGWRPQQSTHAAGGAHTAPRLRG